MEACTTLANHVLKLQSLRNRVLGLNVSEPRRCSALMRIHHLNAAAASPPARVRRPFDLSCSALAKRWKGVGCSNSFAR